MTEVGKTLAAIMGGAVREFILGDDLDLWRGRQHGLNEPLGKI